MHGQGDLELLAEAYRGMVVLTTLPNSPSDAAGLRYGDVLVRCNGRPTSDATAFAEAQRLSPARMDLVVIRDGKEVELSVRLRDTTIPPPAVPAETEEVHRRHSRSRALDIGSPLSPLEADLIG